MDSIDIYVVSFLSKPLAEQFSIFPLLLLCFCKICSYRFKDIFKIIQEINRQGMTILLIEQNANMALKVADIAYVLETGRITMTGSGRELLENPEIKAAYLGKKK